jgi:transposase
MAIWQDLVDDHGFVARYASVRRFVVTLRRVAPAEARGVITTAPGEEGQVDYGGDGPMVRDPITGKYRRVRLFVLTLGYSRKCVRLLTWRSSAQIWAELHEQAFVDWAVRSRSSCSTTSARACSRRTFTIPRSIRSIATS